MRLHFDAWSPTDPAGDSLGEVDLSSGKEVRLEFNAAGSGTVTINRHDFTARTRTFAATILRVRLAEGGPFAYDDPRYFHAFVLDEGQDDEVSEDEEAGDLWVRSGRGLESILRHTVLYEGPYAGQVMVRDDGKAHWPVSRRGAIALRLINEAQARDPLCLPGVVPTFTASVDSNGDGWPDPESNFELDVGIDYYSAFEALRKDGLFYRLNPDLTLDAWGSDPSLDLSASIIFREGVNIYSGFGKEIHASESKTRLLVKGAADPATGIRPILEVTDSVTASREDALNARREGYLDWDVSSDSVSMTRAGRRALLASRRKADGPITGEVTHGTDEPVAGEALHYEPIEDYWVGDSVTVDVPGIHDDEVRKITAITITETDDGEDELDDLAAGEYGGIRVVLELDGDAMWQGDGAGGGAAGTDSPGCTCPLPDECAAVTTPAILGQWNDHDFSGGTANKLTGLHVGGASDGMLIVLFAEDTTGSGFNTLLYYPDQGDLAESYAMTLIDAVAIGKVRVSAFKIDAPVVTAGTGSQVVWSSGSGANHGFAVAIYYVAGLPSFTVPSATGTSITGAIATDLSGIGEGFLIIDAAGISSDNSPFSSEPIGGSADAGQTEDLVIDTTGLEYIGLGTSHKSATGDSETMGWTGWGSAGGYFSGVAQLVLGLEGAVPESSTDLPTDCLLHANDSFGQPMVQGTTRKYMRADSHTGTPELGGVGTVPTPTAGNGGTVGEVGDSLVITVAPSGLGANDGVAQFGHPPADHVDYDGSGSGLAADDVQAAIDEVAARAGSRASTIGAAVDKIGQILTKGTGSEANRIDSPAIFWDYERQRWGMVYTGYSESSGDPLQASIHLAYSDDLRTWTKYASNPILAGDGSGADSNGCTGAFVYYEDGTYYLFYIGLTADGYEGGTKTLNLATATDPQGTWTRQGTIISPGSGWYSDAIWHPNVVKRSDAYYLFFNATGTVSATTTERIGYATASALLGPWTVNATHVLGPTGTGADWDGSLVGDPSLYRVGETWLMAYYGKGTAGNGRDGIAFTTDADFPTGWTRFSGNPVLELGAAGAFDEQHAHKPFIVSTPDGIFHFYTAIDAGDVFSFGLAVSGAARRTVDDHELAADPHPEYLTAAEHAALGGGGQHILLADGHATPFTFNDLLQMDDGSDFMWSDPA